MRLNNIIEKPIITEKSVSMTGLDRYTFRVGKQASKGAVKQAIEALFDVDVVEVRTVIMPGKRRRVRGKNTFTKTPNWKKAVITVKDGQKIAMFDELIGEQNA